MDFTEVTDIEQRIEKNGIVALVTPPTLAETIVVCGQDQTTAAGRRREA